MQHTGDRDMSSPIRLNPSLIASAEREGVIQKRTPPKQIEFWAELGKAVEMVLNYSDVIAILEGIKKITVEPVASAVINPDDVFNSLEEGCKNGDLSERVTSAAVYYEASLKRPGLLDRIDAASGRRLTGRFINGEFVEQG
jgi:hypothetical protein